jgi:hypothetical protein
LALFLVLLSLTSFPFFSLTVLVDSRERFEELFTGSDVDVEDILLHRFHKDPAAVREALHDAEYDEVKKRLDEIERERAILRNTEDWKN